MKFATEQENYLFNLPNGTFYWFYYALSISIICLISNTAPASSYLQQKDIQPSDIAIIAPKNTKTVQEFEFELRKTSFRRNQINTIQVDLFKLSNIRKNNIIITVGAKSLYEVLSKKPEHNVIISTFISENSYRNITSLYSDKSNNLTAIFNDIPFDIQIALAKTLLPRSTSFSCLLGKDSRQYESEIRHAARNYNLKANINIYENESSLKLLFETSIFGSTFILAVPDVAIYNRHSMKHVLLKGYRNNISVIGPSKNIVSIGGLATIYYPIKEVAQLTEQMIKDYKRTYSLPKPVYAKKYDYAINTDVAKSLNVTIPESDSLKKTLKMNWHSNNEN